MLQAIALVACLWFGCPELLVAFEDPNPFDPPPPIVVQEAVREVREPSTEGQSISQAANRGMGNRTSDVEQWRPLVAGHFDPGDVDRVLCLMEHESGGNPDAKNPNSSATGLMQVMASVWASEYGLSASDLYEPEINLWVARKIRDTQGWTAWAPYNRGLCR